MPGSVSQLISEAKAGSDSALSRLWVRYHTKMTQLAQHKVQSHGTVADEEDIVISAFTSFLQRIRSGGYQHLSDRDELWRLLARITINQSKNHNRDRLRHKRGGQATIESLHDTNGRVRDTLFELSSDTPSPDLICEMKDSLAFVMERLADEELQDITLAKLHGYSNAEIAAQLNRSLPTIERRLRLIRDICSID